MPTFDLETTARQLRAARSWHGWSQSELALMSGVRKRSIQTYERGESVMSLMNAAKLAGALGVTIDYLVGNGELP